MRRAAAALLTLSLAVAGCGGEDTDARPERTSTPAPTTTTKFEPCAAPEQEPTARDLIGTPPKDYAVTSMDAESAEALTSRLREGLGDRWDGYDAEVLVRRSTETVVGVIVIHSTEAHGPDPSADLLGGAEEAERDAGSETNPFTVAGRRGVIAKNPDGAFTAVAPVGECSVVFLAAERENTLRDGAALLQVR